MLIAVLFTIAAATVPAQPKQEPTPQKLVESGKIQEAIDSIRKRADPPPDLVYLRALAHKKLDQNDEAKEAFHKLAAAGDDSPWKSIGTSGAEWIEGDLD